MEQRTHPVIGVENFPCIRIARRVLSHDISMGSVVWVNHRPTESGWSMKKKSRNDTAIFPVLWSSSGHQRDTRFDSHDSMVSLSLCWQHARRRGVVLGWSMVIFYTAKQINLLKKHEPDMGQHLLFIPVFRRTSLQWNSDDVLGWLGRDMASDGIVIWNMFDWVSCKRFGAPMLESIFYVWRNRLVWILFQNLGWW